MGEGRTNISVLILLGVTCFGLLTKVTVICEKICLRIWKFHEECLTFEPFFSNILLIFKNFESHIGVSIIFFVILIF